MIKWINELNFIQYAFLVGCGGAIGVLVGVGLINWIEPMPYWLALAGFSGGFYGGLKQRKEKR